MVMQTQIPGEYAALLQSLSMPGGWADTTPFAIGELNPQQISQAFQQGQQTRQAGMRDQLAERQQNMDWGRAGLAYDTAGQALDWQKEKWPTEVGLKREEIGAKRDIGAMKAGFDWQKLGIQEQGKTDRAKMKTNVTEKGLEQRHQQAMTLDRIKLMMPYLKEPPKEELATLAANLRKASLKEKDPTKRLTPEGSMAAARETHMRNQIELLQQNPFFQMLSGGGQQQPQGMPTPQQGPPVPPEIEQPPAPPLWRPGSPLDFLANRQNQGRTLPIAPEDML